VRKLPLDPVKPLIYLITDRLSLPATPNHNHTTTPDLTDFIDRALTAGVDLLQIRERDLPARDILSISEAAVQKARRTGAQILVNDRADVAKCAGAGVHLTTRSLPAETVRRVFGLEMIIGASTHNLEEAMAAENGGADFVVFGPVFETASKRKYGPPLGVEALRAASQCVGIPVLALGGITLANFHETLEAGAAGIAAISLFARSADLEAVVQSIKRFRRLLQT
jgi:thiamine-phosphate pyrophosphorylase